MSASSRYTPDSAPDCETAQRPGPDTHGFHWQKRSGDDYAGLHEMTAKWAMTNGQWAAVIALHRIAAALERIAINTSAPSGAAPGEGKADGGQ